MIKGEVLVNLPDAVAHRVPLLAGESQDRQTAQDDLAWRARSFLSATPRPFLRWAGSKRWLLPHLVPLLPRTFRTYREPFLGSAALFFLLQPERAVLGDTCRELVETFEAVRDNSAAILRYLHPLKPGKKRFYEIRKRRSSGRFQRAAEFIYLNKTCWNGLYRVNSSGAFNVPYGKPKADGIVDDENLRSCAELLAQPGVELKTCDFNELLVDVEEGDLVYLDPPYVTGHSNNGFIDYNEKLFAWEDQVRLAKAAAELDRRGAYVVVTNAEHADVLKLYEGFDVVVVGRRSTLAGDVSARRPVREVIIYNQRRPSERNVHLNSNLLRRLNANL
jgi:DNA adenine methylase